MFWLNLKRVSKTGFISFWRNGLVSFSSVFVLSVTLFIMGSLIVASAFLNASLSELEQKVDINVYFTTSAPEDKILTLQGRLENLPEVSYVEYITREQALEDFKRRNKDNVLILQSLDELEENPLGAVFNIKAINPSQYEGIAEYLEDEMGQDIAGESSGIIDNINYYQNKIVIDRLADLIEGSNKLGVIISIVLLAMAVMVSFNTIRLAIYNSREEIGVMKLVGASKSYIRGPFIVEGVMAGVFATIIAVLLLFVSMTWLSSATVEFFGGLDFAYYYRENFSELFIILLLSGILVGMLASFIAIRRHLEK